MKKKARRKPGRVDRGSESAFRLLSRVVETRRARPKPRRASARARTVDCCHLIHRARHAGRVHDARAHLLACRDASKTFGGFLRQRGGNVRDSRMGFGVRFFVFRRRERKKATCGRRACGLRTSPDGSVGGAEPAFAQALVPFDDDVVRLKERQVRALLVDLRDRLGEFGVVLRRWDAKRATMGTRRGRSVDAGRDAARRGTRRAHRGRGFVVTNAIELDTRRRRVSRRDTTRRRLGRACRTCRRDVSEETMARRRARAHHGRGSRQTSRRVRSTVDAQTPRVGRCVRSRFAFAEETTELRVRRRRCARARVKMSHPQTGCGRASRAIGPPPFEAFSRSRGSENTPRGRFARHDSRRNPNIRPISL